MSASPNPEPQKTRKIQYGNQRVDATPLRVLSVQAEPWAEYLLSDGSILRLKITLYEANRVEGQYEADGTPIYAAKWGIMQHVIAPEELKRYNEHSILPDAETPRE